MKEVDAQVGNLGPVPGGLDDIVQMLPVGVFRASVDGRLAFANAAFLKLVGLDPANPVPPLDLGAVLQDDGSAQIGAPAADCHDDGHVEAPGQGGSRLRARVVVHRVDGGRRSVSVTERLSPDGRGGAWLDGMVEERPQNALPDRLEEAQRFETIGRVSGSIAHDVNNLMTAIGGYASLLRSGLPESDERRRDVDGILEASDRCRDLVARLLDAGRRGVGVPQVVDVVQVVEGVRRLLERVVDGRGRLVVVLHASPLPVRVHPVELEQVLINLVTNARDALREGGSIRLVLSEAGGTDDGQAGWSGRQVVLSVEDDGEGMAEDVAKRVFEPFYTTKGERCGTGLGLSTVRSILERLGGDARLVTRLGGGTRVDVWLPWAEES